MEVAYQTFRLRVQMWKLLKKKMMMIVISVARDYTDEEILWCKIDVIELEARWKQIIRHLP